MGNFFWIFCLLDSLNPPPYGHPLKGGRLPDASFCAALRVPLLRGAGGIRRPALRNFKLLLAQPIPNQLTLFLDIFGHIVSIFANIAIQHTHYC